MSSRKRTTLMAGACLVVSLFASVILLQSIDRMKLAVLFKELRPELTKISVRTRDEIDATHVCVPFGGGGHLRAAGAELPMPLAEAEAAVLPLARRLIDHS